MKGEEAVHATGLTEGEGCNGEGRAWNPAPSNCRSLQSGRFQFGRFDSGFSVARSAVYAHEETLPPRLTGGVGIAHKNIIVRGVVILFAEIHRAAILTVLDLDQRAPNWSFFDSSHEQGEIDGDVRHGDRFLCRSLLELDAEAVLTSGQRAVPTRDRDYKVPRPFRRDSLLDRRSPGRSCQ